MTITDDINLKDLKTVVEQRTTAPLAVTLTGPGVANGLIAKDCVKLIRNVEKLLVAITAEVDPDRKINVKVRGIDNAGEAFTVRFEISEKGGRSRG